MSQAILLHLLAETAIEHPLWNLQRWRSVQFASHATQNSTAATSRFALDQYALPMPWVPAVLDFLKTSFMGVLYLGCTTASGLTAPLTTAPRKSSNAPAKRAGL